MHLTEISYPNSLRRRFVNLSKSTSIDFKAKRNVRKRNNGAILFMMAGESMCCYFVFSGCYLLLGKLFPICKELDVPDPNKHFYGSCLVYGYTGSRWSKWLVKGPKIVGQVAHKRFQFEFARKPSEGSTYKSSWRQTMVKAARTLGIRNGERWKLWPENRVRWIDSLCYSAE